MIDCPHNVPFMISDLLAGITLIINNPTRGCDCRRSKITDQYERYISAFIECAQEATNERMSS